MDYTIFTNSTLGRMCVSFTNGINTGVIEDDQSFMVSLQDSQATSYVQFPSGDMASVQVLERESMPLLLSLHNLLCLIESIFCSIHADNW